MGELWGEYFLMNFYIMFQALCGQQFFKLGIFAICLYMGDE